MHCYESNQKYLNADGFKMKTFFAVAFHRLIFFFFKYLFNSFHIYCLTVSALPGKKHHREQDKRQTINLEYISPSVLFVVQKNDVVKNLTHFLPLTSCLSFISQNRTKQNKHLKALMHAASQRS